MRALKGARKRLSRGLKDAHERLLEAFTPTGIRRRERHVGFRAGLYESSVETRLRRARGTTRGPASSHADQEKLDEIRGACRKAESDSSFTRGLVELFTNNVAGSTLNLQVLTGSDIYNRRMEARMQEWCEREADVRGEQTLQEMVATAARALPTSGDSGFILTSTGQIQPVEADNIASPTGAAAQLVPDGHSVSEGVECNAKGRPVAYWIAPWTSWGVAAHKAKRVGAKDFIHLHRPFRYSQTRTVPLLHACIDDLEAMDDFIEATLMGAQVAACFGVVVKRNTPGDFAEQRSETEEDSGGNSARWENLYPAMLEYLNVDESIETVEPHQPSVVFPDFVYSLARFAMFSLGIPVELFAMDKTTYSGGREAKNIAKKTWRGWQQWIKTRALARIYRWKSAQFVKYEDFPDHKDKWLHTWMMDGWDWVDPIKEVQAAVLAIMSGLSSIPDECMARGKDWQALMNGNAEVIKYAQGKAQELGIEWHELMRAKASDGGGK